MQKKFDYSIGINNSDQSLLAYEATSLLYVTQGYQKVNFILFDAHFKPKF